MAVDGKLIEEGWASQFIKLRRPKKEQVGEGSHQPIRVDRAAADIDYLSLQHVLYTGAACDVWPCSRGAAKTGTGAGSNDVFGSLP